MKTIDEVREIFKNDRFATENGMVIDSIGDNSAVCSVVLCDRHKNAMGNVMGGVSYTLADFAFAVASNHGEKKTVSLSVTSTFLTTAKGDKLTAYAKCVKDGRTTCYYSVEVKDNLDNLVTAVNITGFHVG